MAVLPLEGLMVLEFSHTVMGPTCGVVLADLGADVIRVEPAPDGDRTRRLHGFATGFFAYFNRNKRCICIDLKSPAGHEVARDLLGRADVLIENFAPGTMERLGLGWEQAHAINFRLIYCALKGFLPGPYEHRPALDEVVQFMTGLAYMTGPPGQPLRAGSSVIDIMGGVMGDVAILAALRQRERDGQGRRVTSALFEFLGLPGRPAHGRRGSVRRALAADAGAQQCLGNLRDLRHEIGREAVHRHHLRQPLARLLHRVQPARPAGRSAFRQQRRAGGEPAGAARDRRRNRRRA